MRENYQRILASFKATGYDEGLAKGEAKGKAEGKEEGKLEVARKMKARGYSAEQIAEMTGLDPDQIQTLGSKET